MKKIILAFVLGVVAVLGMGLSSVAATTTTVPASDTVELTPLDPKDDGTEGTDAWDPYTKGKVMSYSDKGMTMCKNSDGTNCYWIAPGEQAWFDTESVYVYDYAGCSEILNNQKRAPGYYNTKYWGFNIIGAVLC